jgi:UDP:flavonoid glycosyltransferase YjiC (YdhE family)
MRVLFTSHPALGHFLPLTPIARAMVEAGHDVAFGTPRFLRPDIEAAGFRWIRAGVENHDPELVAVEAKGRPLRGRARVRFTVEHVFGGVRPRRLVPDLLAVAESWRPDLFVRDCSELGAMIAAELLGVPCAKVEAHAAGEQPYKMPVLVDALRRLRQTLRLPERSIPDLLDHYLVLTPFPSVLTPADTPIAPTAPYLRALPPDSPDAVLPAWIDGLGSRPLIYVSDQRGLEIFPRLLAGLRDVDADIVTTVGDGLDPTALGSQPGHIHLERFLPLGALLPRCSLVLFHGGSGTLVQAITHGLPMVILPLGADQPENAMRCAELGVSRTLDQAHLTPEHIREVVLDVLHTPSYRRSAERLRDEFNTLPGPEFAVELLERLAREKQPILTSR